MFLFSFFLVAELSLIYFWECKKRGRKKRKRKNPRIEKTEFRMTRTENETLREQQRQVQVFEQESEQEQEREQEQEQEQEDPLIQKLFEREIYFPTRQELKENLSNDNILFGVFHSCLFLFYFFFFFSWNKKSNWIFYFVWSCWDS